MKSDSSVRKVLGDGMGPMQLSMLGNMQAKLAEKGITFVGEVEIGDPTILKRGKLCFTVLEFKGVYHLFVENTENMKGYADHGDVVALYSTAKSVWGMNFTTPFPKLEGYRCNWIEWVYQ